MIKYLESIISQANELKNLYENARSEDRLLIDESIFEDIRHLDNNMDDYLQLTKYHLGLI